MHHPDWPRERVAERVAEVLEMVSLDPETYLNRFPVDLSGGQAQRAAIARAIVEGVARRRADERHRRGRAGAHPRRVRRD